MSRTFTIIGHLRGEITSYTSSIQSSAQIVLRTDVEFEGQRFPNIILLNLEIMGNQDDGWGVEDNFTHLFPFMKPVKDFRKFLIKELIRIRDAEARSKSPSCPIWMGIGTYISQLEAFDEARSLIGQSKGVLESLRHQLKDPRFSDGDRGRCIEVLLRLIQLAGKVPVTKQSFRHKAR